MRVTQHFSGNKIENNEINGTCSNHRGYERCIRDLVENPEGKRPLGRPRLRREDNIKIEFQKVGCRGMDWIELAKDRDR